MKINDAIFKAYDIRGIYPDDLNEDVAYLIGRAFAEFAESEKIVVGRDMRTSSPALVKSFSKGANDQGVDVIDIGEVGTDVVYFASGKLDLPGVMFTASHNPAEWNGMKFCLAGARPVSVDTGLRDIEAMVIGNNFLDDQLEGKVEKKDILPDFITHVLSFVDRSKIKPLKIAIDAGNGMAGKLIPMLFKDLPCEVVPLYFELDGSFPNHQPSPMEPENVAELQKKVVEEKCDLGMAFDGDADRIFFIDEKGGRVPSSLPVAMIAKQLLKKHKGAKMIYGVVCSKIVPEIIEANGGEALVERVGHSFIKARMREEDAIYAGEHSGHYYFKDNYQADSGLIAAVLILENISEDGRPFSEILKDYQKYFAIEETNSEVEDKKGKMKEIEDVYRDSAKRISKQDGVTVEFDDWWFNVRPSNTESLLRLNLEAKDEKTANEKTEEVLKIIRS